MKSQGARPTAAQVLRIDTRSAMTTLCFCLVLCVLSAGKLRSASAHGSNDDLQRATELIAEGRYKKAVALLESAAPDSTAAMLLSRADNALGRFAEAAEAAETAVDHAHGCVHWRASAWPDELDDLRRLDRPPRR